MGGSNVPLVERFGGRLIGRYKTSEGSFDRMDKDTENRIISAAMVKQLQFEMLTGSGIGTPVSFCLYSSRGHFPVSPRGAPVGKRPSVPCQANVQGSLASVLLSCTVAGVTCQCPPRGAPVAAGRRRM